MLFTVSYTQAQVNEFSHYLFPEFTKGVVLMKTGIKNEALLNYNSLTEEMVFDNKGRKLALTKKEMEFIDTVYIRDRKFFVLNNEFTELVYHSTWDLYAGHKCRINDPGKPIGYGATTQTSAVTSYSSYHADGRIYELKLPDGYEVKPYIVYWLMKDGKLNKFISIRQLMKLYEEKKDLARTYTKKHNVKYDDQVSIVQFINYLEKN
jgi:hypothetical protein